MRVTYPLPQIAEAERTGERPPECRYDAGTGAGPRAIPLHGFAMNTMWKVCLHAKFMVFSVLMPLCTLQLSAVSAGSDGTQSVSAVLRSTDLPAGVSSMYPYSFQVRAHVCMSARRRMSRHGLSGCRPLQVEYVFSLHPDGCLCVTFSAENTALHGVLPFSVGNHITLRFPFTRAGE